MRLYVCVCEFKHIYRSSMYESEYVCMAVKVLSVKVYQKELGDIEKETENVCVYVYVCV